MKKILLAGTLMLSSGLLFAKCNINAESGEAFAAAGDPPVERVSSSDNTRVQVALLLDTSNSMDGLIDQAEVFASGVIRSNTINLFPNEGELRHRAAEAAIVKRDPPYTASAAERIVRANLLRDIFGNPFRPVTFDPVWRSDTAVSITRGMYESRDFSAMPILADALQDAGCDSDDVLTHCREEKHAHVRGCWVVDTVLGKV